VNGGVGAAVAGLECLSCQGHDSHASAIYLLVRRKKVLVSSLGALVVWEPISMKQAGVDWVR